MQRRDNLLLLGLAILVYASLAWFQHYPGYMDANYYFVTGQQIASGQGFTQPFIWNYLDSPQSIPHPSHSYWMPLASLVAAAGMFLTGSLSFQSARLGFFLAAIMLPLLTYSLAFRLTGKRDNALLAGLLAVFPPYLASFFITTDNFSLLALLGACFFLLDPRRSILQAVLLGLVCGLMNLSRSDGLLWVVMATLGIFWRPWLETGRLQALDARPLVGLATGYLLAMLPWVFRNLQTFGVPLAPGGSHLLWMLGYNEIFLYPAGMLTSERFWEAGLGEILSDRGWAFQNNLGNAIGVQGAIFVTPLILLGWFKLREQFVVRQAGLAWLLLIAAMTIFFPFAGARGGYFHAAAAFQPLWWALTPVGLDAAVGWARRRDLFTPQAFTVFRVMLLVLVLALSGYLAFGRMQSWNSAYPRYSEIESFLLEKGAASEDRVMVVDPPAYYHATGRQGLVMPEGDPLTALQVACQFGARYLILEEGSLLEWLQPFFDTPASRPGYLYLGGGPGWEVYELVP